MLANEKLGKKNSVRVGRVKKKGMRQRWRTVSVFLFARDWQTPAILFESGQTFHASREVYVSGGIEKREKFNKKYVPIARRDKRR